MLDSDNKNSTDMKKNETEKKQFINEKRIKANPLRKAFKHLLKALALGATFGIAAIFFAMAFRPVAEKIFPKPTTTAETTVSISRDEPETETTAIVIETTPDLVENVVEDVLKKYQYKMDDINKFAKVISGLSDALDYGIVSVYAVKNTTDWFNNPVETSEEGSGAIIANTETELLILAPMAAISEASSIKVRLFTGLETQATIKRTDRYSGLCVLSVLKEGLDNEKLKDIRTLALGNSYAVKRGDVIIAIGSPLGAVYSNTYGSVSYIANNVSIVDGMTRLIYTEANSNINKGTWFVNVNGEIIGWATNIHDDDNPKTMVAGISDFKPILERMMNAQASAYLGIKVTEISSEARATGVPSGLYVMSCETDSPSYTAGIQAGDIITHIGNNEVSSLVEYKKMVEVMHAEDVVEIKVMRNVREGYKEVVFPITVTAR